MSDVSLTQNWWRKVVSDEVRLALWLQKLQLTEIGGAEDHYAFMKANDVPERESKILTQIALDETKHSGILLELMSDMKIVPKSRGDDGTVSLYWTEMNKEVKTLKDYCGINYFGESLAADRFQIIHSMKETPSDIKYFISKALPDEIFHRETLMRLAGAEVMERLRPTHDRVFAQLTRK